MEPERLEGARSWCLRSPDAPAKSNRIKASHRNGKGGVRARKGWILALEGEATEVIPNESISIRIAGQCGSKWLLFCTSDTLALRRSGEPWAPSGADSPQV